MMPYTRNVSAPQRQAAANGKFMTPEPQVAMFSPSLPHEFLPWKTLESADSYFGAWQPHRLYAGSFWNNATFVVADWATEHSPLGTMGITFQKKYLNEWRHCGIAVDGHGELTVLPWSFDPNVYHFRTLSSKYTLALDEQIGLQHVVAHTLAAQERAAFAVIPEMYTSPESLKLIGGVLSKGTCDYIECAKYMSHVLEVRPTVFDTFSDFKKYNTIARVVIWLEGIFGIRPNFIRGIPGVPDEFARPLLKK